MLDLPILVMRQNTAFAYCVTKVYFYTGWAIYFVDMKNFYKNNHWLEFREQVIELEGYACTKCGKTVMDGVILQVHHKHYVTGKKPWEYALNSCETLCKRCHAEEHGEIRPETGWELTCEDDLGGLDGTCDRCGTEIRYVFHVQHPHWEPISVGTFCCDDLTGTKLASEARKQDERLKRFLVSKRWNEQGYIHSIKQKKTEIEIYPEGNGFRVRIGQVAGKKIYQTVESAKMRIFEFFDEGEDEKFFSGNRKNHRSQIKK